MIKLSDRLKAIEELIYQGETVADIGTDHGFLPMSLWEAGKSPNVILSDVKVGPLKKAEANIAKYFPDQRFDLRIGNGLQTLEYGEVDAVVIAGMGGIVISDILAEDINRTNSFKRYILQPRNAQKSLRAWLLDNGFVITDEKLVREGKYICEIISAVSENRSEEAESYNAFVSKVNYHMNKEYYDMDLEISPILFVKKEPLLVEFIENKIKIELNILNSLKTGAKTDKSKKVKLSEDRVKSLRKYLKRSMTNEYEYE
ncbi:MAG: class I SAM-dependent methyltransferase [Eubacteriales bacterium]|nr:class I SAM-dependent methyltransferase [Eubacteriales bacterium]